MISLLKRLAVGLEQSVDGSTSVYIRVIVGAFIAQWAWDYLDEGIVTRLYIEPKFHFTYYGLDWIQPLPGNGMILFFASLILLGVAIATGFLYRISSAMFAAAFTYFFLLERTNYQNHYYLMMLVAWWLPFLPLNREFSIDAWLKPAIRTATVPSYVPRILQFHFALPYVMGGFAKLNPDWLLGQPMSEMLLAKQDLPFLGDIFCLPWAGIWMSWMGLLFDLAIVPMLWWKRSRLPAFLLCLVFHLLNAVVFNIHIFPWLMLAATPIFFEPDWIRRALGGMTSSAIPSIQTQPFASQPSMRSFGFTCFMILYVAFHGLWPLRHHLYSGDASWTERGHYFAWRMMLRGKKAVLGYAIRDSVTGRVTDGRVNDFLSKEQADKFGRDPEMILHYAHFIADQYKQSTGHSAAVYALALASLNGRKAELFIDPNRDLTKIERYSTDRSWVMPQKETLRFPVWNVPVEKWREDIAIPELTFLRKP